jgi:hypothetical protein
LAHEQSGQLVDDRSLVLCDAGDKVVVQAGDDGIRFLLVSGEPLKEPVALYGPIVMNTQEQLQRAFEELHEGTFSESKQMSLRARQGLIHLMTTVHGTEYRHKHVCS